jgi:hypothetical protein
VDVEAPFSDPRAVQPPSAGDASAALKNKKMLS